MTAELIVMNKNGLALAADSAASIASGSGPAKIYNTANKLFALSKYHPVGVMIYGSAEIMGLPWEIVIKRYREVLGDKSFQTLNEYSDNFFEHLKNKAFTPNCYVEYVKQQAAEFFAVIMSDVDERVKTLSAKDGGVKESDAEQIHATSISEAYKQISNALKEMKIKRISIDGSASKHRGAVKARITSLLGGRPVKGLYKRKLIDVCLIVAIALPGMSESGLVIAGFGENEVFPSAKAFEISKVLDGKIQFSNPFSGQVTLTNTVHIRAFAQSNETQNFMNGVSSRIEDYFGAEVNKVLTGSFADQATERLINDKLISSEKRKECKSCLSSAGKAAHIYLQKRLRDISHLEFSGPVVNAVKFFSPTEMATMAETLVSLESFRQQVTLCSETVGGPIDVAVITRGDGFIWMKRKHYFSPEYNHQYFSNYNRTAGKQNDCEKA